VIAEAVVASSIQQSWSSLLFRGLHRNKFKTFSISFRFRVTVWFGSIRGVGSIIYNSDVLSTGDVMYRRMRSEDERRNGCGDMWSKEITNSLGEESRTTVEFESRLPDVLGVLLGMDTEQWLWEVLTERTMKITRKAMMMMIISSSNGSGSSNRSADTAQ
jgi:hypothetical protein